MNTTEPAFEDIVVRVLRTGEAVTYDSRRKRLRKLPSRLIMLTWGSSHENQQSVFRHISEEKEKREVIRLCYTNLGGLAQLMEGRTIGFQQWHDDVYYHLLMPSCDPREGVSKMMAKSKFDVHPQIAENYDLERHLDVYGRSTSKGNGICAIIRKGDYGAMARIFFFEKLLPLTTLMV